MSENGGSLVERPDGRHLRAPALGGPGGAAAPLVAPGGQGPPGDPRATRLEAAISAVLRVGVALSVVIIFIGVVLVFARHHAYVTTTGPLHALTKVRAAFPHSVGEIWSGLGHLQGESVIMLGLLVLLLTPVMRVVVSIALFRALRDRAFVVIASLILVILVASFFLGRSGG